MVGTASPWEGRPACRRWGGDPGGPSPRATVGEGARAGKGVLTPVPCPTDVADPDSGLTNRRQARHK